ncbi:MAG: DUF4419 domain-containing protein [bacterium]|nr:DUF4419 domain-containing protein [bacterium]
MVERIGRGRRIRTAKRSLALPPRTSRFTRVFVNAAIESRGRVSLDEDAHRRRDVPFSITQVQEALREIDSRIAGWEKSVADPTSRWPDSARQWLDEDRDTRTCIAGLERAVAFFPEHEFITRVSRTGVGNGLLGAALEAYTSHQGFVLAPEAFLATVTQGVARFIFEGDRARIRDSEREQLEASVFPDDPIISTNAALIAEELAFAVVARDEFAARLMGTIQSMRAIEGYAPLTDITLLAAFDARYRYIGRWMACGIRRIELEGAPSEWQRIVHTARALRSMPELEPLDPWLTTVGEVADRIAHFDSRSEASNAFMRRVVQYQEPACSLGHASGWVTNLFPYYHGKLRTEFPVEGSGEQLDVFGGGLDDHLLARARVRIVPQASCPGEPFDIQLVAGLDAVEEPCGDMLVYRPVPFHGLLAPIRT